MMNTKTFSEMLESEAAKRLNRLVGILTLPVASLLVWLGAQWLDNRFDEVKLSISVVRERVESVETEIENVKTKTESNSRVLQDHESRMVFGRAQREALAAEAKERFGVIHNQLDVVSDKLEIMNTGIVSLRTIIQERVPPRAGGLSEARPSTVISAD